MKNYDNSVRISETLDKIRARAAARDITARDLSDMERASLRTDGRELRRRFAETLASLKSCGVLSRMDSHHWDRGLCDLESSEEIICVAEGFVLCFDGETAAAYPPEEVRKIGGARF